MTPTKSVVKYMKKLTACILAVFCFIACSEKMEEGGLKSSAMVIYVPNLANMFKRLKNNYKYISINPMCEIGADMPIVPFIKLFATKDEEPIDIDLNNPESDAEDELLVEGVWEFDWTYHYKSNAHEYRVLKTFENQGITYYLTKVEISPISVRMEAFCMPQDRNKIRPTDLIQKITYKDGTRVEIPGDSSSGVRDGMFVDSFVDVGMTGEVLRSNEVKSITISGTEIELK